MRKIIQTNKIVVPLLVAALVILVGSSAYAQKAVTPKLRTDVDWYYGCYPRTTVKPSVTTAPNILMALDVSGSMHTADDKSLKLLTRLERVSMAIRELVVEARERKSFNLGLITYSTRVANDCMRYYDVNHCTKAYTPCNGDPDDILYDLSKVKPNGDTPTDMAIDAAVRHSCITETERPKATLIISDGEPTRGKKGRRKEDAIDSACRHRKTAPLYVLGLGKAGSVEGATFNNLLAAAGGTGQCVNTLTGAPFDPCSNEAKKIYKMPVLCSDANYYNGTADGVDCLGTNKFLSKHNLSCSGAFQASNSKEVIDVLHAVVDGLGCYLPLDTTPIDTREIPTDPKYKYPWISVELNKRTGGKERILNAKDPAATPGKTWEFVSDKHDIVKLGKAACAAINGRGGERISNVTTEVGCLCRKKTGTVCGGPGDQDVSNISPDECSTKGKYTCDRGINKCEGGTQVETGGVCSTGEKGICALGRTECKDGKIICRKDLEPMPEVCNGIDDDCNGRDDDITPSWGKSSFDGPLSRVKTSAPETYSTYKSQACEIKDYCVCNTLKPASVNAPSRNGKKDVEYYGDYVHFWDSAHGDCFCQTD